MINGSCVSHWEGWGGEMQLIISITIRMLRGTEGGLGFILHYHSFENYVYSEWDLCAKSLQDNHNLSRTEALCQLPSIMFIKLVVRIPSMKHITSQLQDTCIFIHTDVYGDRNKVSQNKTSFLLIVPSLFQFLKSNMFHNLLTAWKMLR